MFQYNLVFSAVCVIFANSFWGKVSSSSVGSSALETKKKTICKKFYLQCCKTKVQKPYEMKTCIFVLMRQER